MSLTRFFLLLSQSLKNLLFLLLWRLIALLKLVLIHDKLLLLNEITIWPFMLRSFLTLQTIFFSCYQKIKISHNFTHSMMRMFLNVDVIWRCYKCGSTRNCFSRQTYRTMNSVWWSFLDIFQWWSVYKNNKLQIFFVIWGKTVDENST